MQASQPDLDVLVIGAGQAGLAAGYHLRETGVRYELLDGFPRVGDSWRRRFDSLLLFTPRSYSALPGLSLGGDADGYPDKDEIADYLEAYAARFRLPVRAGTRVTRLAREDGVFVATTPDARIRARSVIVATGAFQRPRVPPIASGFGPDVRQLTPDSYRNPSGVPAGTVLVVGDGATGRQIALELARTHRVVLSTGRRRRPSRERLLGRSIFWWLDRLGVLRASRDSLVGRRLMAADPFPGRGLDLPRLAAGGVGVEARLTAAEGRTATFANGRSTEVESVIWATGYRDDTDWLAIPGAVHAGAFVERRGVSPVPGLFFVGRSWQWTRGSALLAGVGDDAAYVVRAIQGVLGPDGAGEAPATSSAA